MYLNGTSSVGYLNSLEGEESICLLQRMLMSAMQYMVIASFMVVIHIRQPEFFKSSKHKNCIQVKL